MISTRSLCLIYLLFCLSCTPGVDIDNPDLEVEAILQQLLDESLTGSGNNNPGTSMTVIVPDLKINWSGVTGFDSMENTDSLQLNQHFRIASVTKTFVAATILRMEEEKMLLINDPISRYIDTAFVNLLVVNGYNPDRILIHHCLTNTSGLFNYAQGGQSYLDRVFSNPTKKWTRQLQIEHAMEFGEPQGAPGERYHYSDTGYILLGNIIENITGEHYGVTMRKLLKFHALGMRRTWLEDIEQQPADAITAAHRYFDDTDYSNLDASIDLFGGGGLMSTTYDMATFFSGLFNEKIYEKEETLAKMIANVSYDDSYVPADDKKYLDYRKGIYGISIYGMDAYRHSGFWGSSAIHVPEINLTISADAINGSTDRMLKKAILLINNSKNQN